MGPGGYRMRQETTEKSQRGHRPKRWVYSNKDVNNSSNIMNKINNINSA